MIDKRQLIMIYSVAIIILALSAIQWTSEIVGGLLDVEFAGITLATVAGGLAFWAGIELWRRKI